MNTSFDDIQLRSHINISIAKQRPYLCKSTISKSIKKSFTINGDTQTHTDTNREHIPTGIANEHIPTGILGQIRPSFEAYRWELQMNTHTPIDESITMEVIFESVDFWMNDESRVSILEHTNENFRSRISAEAGGISNNDGLTFTYPLRVGGSSSD